MKKFSYLLICILPLLVASCDNSDNRDTGVQQPHKLISTTYLSDPMGLDLFDLTYLDATMGGVEVSFDAAADMMSGTMTLSRIFPVAGDVVIDVAMAKRTDSDIYDLTVSADDTFTLDNGTLVTFGEVSVKAKQSSKGKGLFTMEVTAVEAQPNILSANTKTTGWWNTKISYPSSKPISPLYLDWHISHLGLNFPQSVIDGMIDFFGEIVALEYVELLGDLDDAQFGDFISAIRTKLLPQVLPDFKLSDVISKLEFKTNGQITARYSSEKTEGGQPIWSYTPEVNIITQYVSDDDSKLYVRLNADEIIRLAVENSKEPEAASLSTKSSTNKKLNIAELLKNLNRLLTNDYEFAIRQVNGKGDIIIYLSEQAIFPVVDLLKSITAMNPNDLADLISTFVGGIDSTLIEFLQDTINQLIDNTNSFEVGFYLLATETPTDL